MKSHNPTQGLILTRCKINSQDLLNFENVFLTLLFMETFKNFILKLLGSILRTVIISIVLMLISYTVMTGNFPPRLDEMKRTLSMIRSLSQKSIGNMQKMQDRFAQQLDQQLDKHKEITGEANVEDLVAYAKERAKVGAQLSHVVGAGKTIANSDGPTEIQIKEFNPEDIKTIRREVQYLRFQVQNIDNKLDTLINKKTR